MGLQGMMEEPLEVGGARHTDEGGQDPSRWRRTEPSPLMELVEYNIPHDNLANTDAAPSRPTHRATADRGRAGSSRCCGPSTKTTASAAAEIQQRLLIS